MNNNAIVIIAAAISLVSLAMSGWLIWRFNRLDRIRKEFFASGLKKDLEQILVDQNRAITKLNQELKEQDDGLTRLYKDNRANIQKVGFIRFNPFDDAGGNMSFVVALLNAKDEGVVISSLHGREGTRMYAKAVVAGLSESKLTDEEMEAIKEAK
jgi:hypothetical protein